MVELIWESLEKDEDGFPQNKKHSINVHVLEEKSITRAEAYDSMRAGVSVKTVLVIRQEDFEDTRHMIDKKAQYARKAIYKDSEYDIIRTYKVGKSKIEIVCG